MSKKIIRKSKRATTAKSKPGSAASGWLDALWKHAEKRRESLGERRRKEATTEAERTELNIREMAMYDLTEIITAAKKQIAANHET